MAYPDRVIGRMVSNLWFQIGSHPPAYGVSSSGVGGLRTPPAQFGVPEHVPELTYIVAAHPDDNGFIQEAIDYHTTYGLVPANHTPQNPVTFTSIENLIDILHQNTSHIGRLRIVAHVGLDTSAGVDANMNVAFFEGGPVRVGKEILQGFADSDEAGLRALLFMPNFLNPTTSLLPSLVPDILSFLRPPPPPAPPSSTVLTPFGLDTTDPSDLIEQYFFILSDTLFVKHVIDDPSRGDIRMKTSPTADAQFTGDQLTILSNALQIIRERIESQIMASTNISSEKLDALRDAVLAMTMADLGKAALGGRPFERTRINRAGNTIYLDPMQYVGVAVEAIKNRNFRQRLESIRARFDQNSWIDIRGCRIGQDTDYLEAVRSLFGRENNLPSVSGPTLRQAFWASGHYPLPNEAAIDNLWNHGIQFTVGNPPHTQNVTYSSQTIQNLFNNGASGVEELSGVAIHIDFWKQVSQLQLFDFAAMFWKGDFPTLPIRAPQLEGFTGLDFSDTINRIATIFHLQNSLQTPATLSRIEDVHAQLVALQSEFVVIDDLLSQGTPAAPDLSQSFDRLRQISQQLNLLTVPAAAPSPLQIAHLQTYATRLKTYFQIVVIPGGPANLYQAYLDIEELATMANPPDADLGTQFDNLKNIQSGIGANNIVPDNRPADLDAETLQGYIESMIEHLETTADLSTFQDDLSTKAQSSLPDVPASFRYYFFIGLPLLVDELNGQFFLVLQGQEDPAIRSFMNAHWQEPLPSPNRVATAQMGQNRARQVSLFVERTAAGADIAQYINPYPEYNEHIETVP